MTLEIKHMDTFNTIKCILQAFHDSSAESYNEICELLKQMEKVPETDGSGFFVEEEPLMEKIKALIPNKEYTDAEENLIDLFIRSIDGHEAMGPVCYSGYCLKRELMKNDHECMWVDDIIELYEKEAD